MLCVCVCDCVLQSGWYIFRWSRQSGLWALPAWIRHESTQCCKTTGQRTAPARTEDQSEAVWPADASICGRQTKHQGKRIQRHWNVLDKKNHFRFLLIFFFIKHKHFSPTTHVFRLGVSPHTCVVIHNTDLFINMCSYQVVDFEGLVCSLNEQGFLLKKGFKLYQLQTVWSLTSTVDSRSFLQTSRQGQCSGYGISL